MAGGVTAGWKVKIRLAGLFERETDFYNLGNWPSIRAFMMRRNKDGVNGVMADMSTNYVKVEELWQYKWHKKFQKRSVPKLNWLTDDL